MNTAHNGTVNGLCFTSHGLHLLSFGTDYKIRLWDVESGKNLLVNFGKLDNDSSQKCIHFAVSEHTDPEIVFVPVDHKIEVFHIHSGERVTTLRGHYYQVNSCVFNDNTQELYSCGNDRNILLWTPQTENFLAYDKYLKEGVEDMKTVNFLKRTGAVMQDEWSSDED